MLATMLVAAIVASVYIALIGGHVTAIRAGAPAGELRRPNVARWIAASSERRRARAEAEAVYGLMTGMVDRADYQATMAVLAAQDDMEYPLSVPKTLL